MNIKKNGLAGFIVFVAFMMITPAVFAKYAGPVDYESVYDPKNYESEFYEDTVIAVMQPEQWGGSAEEYEQRAVFDGIGLDGIDVIYRCDEPSDDKMGDVLMLHLAEGGRENVLEVIDILKDNEYVIYSLPSYIGSGDDEDADDDCDDDISIAADTYEYYLDGGAVYFNLKQNGRQVIALYKDNRLVSSALGSRIDITGKDFDTLKLMLWNDVSSMRPAQECISLSYDEVMSAGTMEPQYSDIPNVYLTGDISEMSKENKVTLQMKYKSATGEVNGWVSAKWQGNYASMLEKKNFSVKLYKDEALDKKLNVEFKDWDKSNNFVLKANYVDATAARNIVCARLYQTLPDTYMQNGSQGVVDGFPVRLYINDEFWGLYTWNKPKKGWTFGMSKSTPNALLYFANYALGSGIFQNKYSTDKFWELVYPDEHEDVTEFDRVTEFIANSSDEDFKAHIEEYMDLNSLLNFYVFSQVIMHCDGTGKNMNAATYDGNLWYIRPYDMDATFGIEWYGYMLKPYDTDMGSDEFMRRSKLWCKLEDNFPQEIYDRYILLRNDQLSEQTILSAFEYFMDEVGADLYAENLERWPDTPGKGFMLNQITDFLNTRYSYLDTYMEKFNSNS